jgi:hypothetical protein
LLGGVKSSVGRYYRVSTEKEGSISKNKTQIKAAVVREKSGPFNVETLTLEGPRRDEVLVKVVATGLCHTDMVARDKFYPVPQPIVLGHEGAGLERFFELPIRRRPKLGWRSLRKLDSCGQVYARRPEAI